ncbi:hypothetical protein [Sulfurospirillum cavolei]|uniref:hypothetical protein n=1 Tax=Sulfurospirillum cavolei TaxID=366522 RepID=UPI0007649740|nr:hypothetical protein [Sulfurospirillum cavolei]
MEDAFKYFKLAKKLNEKYKDKLNEIDEDNQGKMHCRGNVKGISLVSLDSKTPEMGYSGIKTEEKFMTLISPKKVLEEPKRKTPEKLLQAIIIDKAMGHPSHLLPFGDNIQFITSELVMYDLANQKIVNDILGFSKNNELYIIELKSSRFLTELQKQVNDFEVIVKYQADFFYDLLKIYGLEWDRCSIQKAVVWPKCHSKNKVFQNDVIEFTYEKEILEQEKQSQLIIEEAQCV